MKRNRPSAIPFSRSADIPLAPIKGLLEDYAAGDGTFFQIFLVQQSGAGVPITVVYDDFYITPEPGRSLLLALAAVGLMWRRRRVQVPTAAAPLPGCVAQGGYRGVPRGS